MILLMMDIKEKGIIEFLLLLERRENNFYTAVNITRIYMTASKTVSTVSTVSEFQSSNIFNLNSFIFHFCKKNVEGFSN